MNTTNVLLSIILVVIYLGVGYISTLVMDTIEDDGDHHIEPKGKIFSIFLWPLMLIGYLFVKFE